MCRYTYIHMHVHTHTHAHTFIYLSNKKRMSIYPICWFFSQIPTIVEAEMVLELRVRNSLQSLPCG